MTAISYRPVAMTDNTYEVDMNNANIPKSAGLYIRVNSGEIAIGITWAIVVPVISVRTLDAKDPGGAYRAIRELTAQ